MKAEHPPQFDRFEFKYLIPEETAGSLRDFLAEYGELDNYCQSRPTGTYLVHNLYLDSHLHDLYWRTVNHFAHCCDLRLRLYNDQVEDPIKLQIKRWNNNLVHEDSTVQSRGVVQTLLDGNLPELSEDAPNHPADQAVLEHFHRLLVETNAQPRVHVAFHREAWVFPGEGDIRVTLDRLVHCEQIESDPFDLELHRPVPVYERKMILELKFREKFPSWCQELVEVFNCTPASIAKYVDSMRRLDSRAEVGTDTGVF